MIPSYINKLFTANTITYKFYTIWSIMNNIIEANRNFCITFVHDERHITTMKGMWMIESKNNGERMTMYIQANTEANRGIIRLEIIRATANQWERWQHFVLWTEFLRFSAPSSAKLQIKRFRQGYMKTNAFPSEACRKFRTSYETGTFVEHEWVDVGISAQLHSS